MCIYILYIYIYIYVCVYIYIYIYIFLEGPHAVKQTLLGHADASGDGFSGGGALQMILHPAPDVLLYPCR